MAACHFGRENNVEHNVLISHFKEGFTYAMAQESIMQCTLHVLLARSPTPSNSLALSLWHAQLARSKYFIEHCCAPARQRLLLHSITTLYRAHMHVSVDLSITLLIKISVYHFY